MSIQTDTKRALPPKVIKQLVFVKRLFLDTQAMASQEDNELAHLKAFLILDLSMETLFKLIISDLDPDGKESGVKLDEKRDPEFRILRNGVNNLLKRKMQSGKYEIPNEVLAYRRIRNQAQHDAKIPRLSYLRDYLDDASEILEKLYRELYGIDVWSLRHWDAISNPALREWLQNCEDALQSQRLGLALVGTHAAYKQLMDGLIRLVYPDPDIPFAVMQSPSTDDRLGNADSNVGKRIKDTLDSLNRHFLEHFARLYERMLLQHLGLQQVRTRRFEQIYNGLYVSISTNGTVLCSSNRSFNDVEGEDVKFALDYVFDFVWEVQETYPDYLRTFDFRKHLRDQEFWRFET